MKHILILILSMALALCAGCTVDVETVEQVPLDEITPTSIGDSCTSDVQCTSPEYCDIGMGECRRRCTDDKQWKCNNGDNRHDICYAGHCEYSETIIPGGCTYDSDCGRHGYCHSSGKCRAEDKKNCKLGDGQGSWTVVDCTDTYGQNAACCEETGLGDNHKCDLFQYCATGYPAWAPIFP
jgi:hypothetical protein